MLIFPYCLDPTYHVLFLRVLTAFAAHIASYPSSMRSSKSKRGLMTSDNATNVNGLRPIESYATLCSMKQLSDAVSKGTIPAIPAGDFDDELAKALDDQLVQTCNLLLSTEAVDRPEFQEVLKFRRIFQFVDQI